MELNSDHIELIEKVAKENGFQKFEITVTPGSNKGDNYLGIINRIIFQDGKKNLKIIMKCAQSSEFTRKLNPIRNQFLREIYMYEKVFTDFAAFSEEYNQPNIFRAHPKLYAMCNKEKSESLILEDMKERDFQMGDKTLTMNSQHIEAVLKEYAKYHSTSLAMGHKQPERFKTLSRNILTDVYSDHINNKEGEEHWEEFTDALIENAFDAVKGNHMAIEALKKYQKYTLKEIFYSVVPEDNIVITHGDCWCNNLLFRYEDENKDTPSEVCILDWQLSKLGSPAIDISSFLFLNGSKEILDDYETYTKFYHDMVSQNLKEFSCDPDIVFPYEFFKNQFNKYTKHVFVFCILLLRIMHYEQEEAPDFEARAQDENPIEGLCKFKFSKIDEYHRRIAILVNFMLKNNLF